MRPGYTIDSAYIDWTNKEVWHKLAPQLQVKASPPAPPLLAAGAKGALPDYWAATFKASADRGNGDDGRSAYSRPPAIIASGGAGALQIHSSSASQGGAPKSPVRPGAAPAGYLPRMQPISLPAEAMRGDWEDASEDEDAGAYPYDLPPERPSAMAPKLSSSGIGGVARLSGDGGSCGGLLLSMLLLLLTPLALAASAFVLVAYQRRGSLTKQQLADDAAKLFAAVQAARAGAGWGALCSRRMRSGMQVISASDDVHEETIEQESWADRTAGAVAAMGARAAPTVATIKATVAGLRSAIHARLSPREIVSASEGIDVERGAQGGAFDDGSSEEEERAAPPRRTIEQSGRFKRGAGDGAGASGRMASAYGEIAYAGGYEFEGEKLSWETEADRPRPSEHPEAYVIEDDTEEVC